MSKKIFSFITTVCLLFSFAAPYSMAAEQVIEPETTQLQVTKMYASANGWQNNTNWIAFELNKELDLSKDGSDVAIFYEYVEDGKIYQMRNETESGVGTVYTKNKLWSGYLVANDGTNNVYYSSGAENDTNYSNILPANTLLMSNLTNVTTKFPRLTKKIEEEKVQYFRVRLVVNDEEGKQVNDSYSNWIKYEANLTASTPKGLTFVEDYQDTAAESLPNTKTSAKIGEKEYATVDLAVAAAKDGDEIVLGEGTYEIFNELNIDKNISIKGAGKEKTIISYNSTYNNPTATEYFGGRIIYPVINAGKELSISGLTVQATTDKHHGIDGIYTTSNLYIEDAAVNDVRCTADGADVCGVQYGRAVIANGSEEIVISKTDICRFQKQAVDVNNVNSITITDSVIQGVGEQAIIAQNGIILRNSNAVVTATVIKDMKYNAENDWKDCSVAVYLVDGAKAEVSASTISAVNNAFCGDEETEFILSDSNILEDSQEFTSDSIADITIVEQPITLKIGETLTITNDITPENFEGDVVWNSSHPKTATVNEGVVTPLKVGTTVVTVTAGNKSKKCEVSVVVGIKNTKGLKIVNNAKGRAVVTWNKVEGADGYQIYRMNCYKGDSYKLIKTITDSETVKLVNKNLRKGNILYYKVRAYKLNANGKKIFSEFTKTRKVAIKK